MKNKKKKWCIRLAAMVVILAFICIQEGIANYHALTQGYDAIEVDGSMELIREDGKEKYCLTYTLEEPIYVDQLKITGKFKKNYQYDVDVVAVNSYGKTEEINYNDKVDPLYEENYTKIGEKIVSLQITMLKAAGESFEAATLSNQPEINKYRILFWLIVLCFFYVILFEKSWLQKPEWIFVAFAIGFGSLLIVTAQPERVSWDEQIHFRNAYRIAFGETVEWSESALVIKDASGPENNTKAEYAQLREYMDENGSETAVVEDRLGTHLEYDDLAYVPQALMLKLGMTLGMSFSTLYAFGKIGNLLVYVIAMFFAIRLAKYRKLFLLFFAMMPTVLFQAASYTYDNVVTSFVTLGCVLWANMAFSKEETYTPGKIILVILLWVVGCFSKAVYIPIVLLCLMLPQFMDIKKRRRLIIFGGIFLVFFLVMMTFVLPAISNTVSGNLSYGGDARGGDTSTVRQMISMLKHPLTSVKVMVTNMFSLDNFRNLGDDLLDDNFFGNLMFLNFATLGIMKAKWSALLVPMFVILLFYKDETEESYGTISAGKRIFMLLVLLVILFLIWLALYLSFTPVGDETIAGVQARYYLPLIYFFGILVMNNRIQIRMDRQVLTRLTVLSTGLFTSVMIYQYCLVGRLL